MCDLNLERTINGLRNIVSDKKMQRKCDYYVNICRDALHLLETRKAAHNAMLDDAYSVLLGGAENVELVMRDKGYRCRIVGIESSDGPAAPKHRFTLVEV